MNLITMRETNIPLHRFRHALRHDKLRGQTVGGVYVFTQEQLDAWKAGNPPVDASVELFSPREAARYLGVGQRAIYTLIREGTLKPVKEIQAEGKMPLKILTKKQLDEIRSVAENTKKEPGRPISDNVDTFLDKRNGYYFIRNSRNRQGEEYHYRNKYKARWKARNMIYGNPQYAIGEKVIVLGKGTGEIMALVSPIDMTALVAIKGKWELVPTRLLSLP